MCAPRALIIAALSVLGLLVVPAAGWAATYTVTTTADSNDGSCTPARCSLRDAVIAANATPANDTIILPAGDYRLTIKGNSESASATGDLNVADQATAGTLAITGDSARTTTIDASGLGDDRALQVQQNGNLTLSKVTVTGGVLQDKSDGGGAIATDGTLDLESVDIVHNEALNTAGGYGGGGGLAIFTDATKTVINNSTFSDNHSPGDGGAVYKEDSGTLKVTNSTFTGNSADTSLPNTKSFYGAYGGAFEVDSGTTTITNSTIAGNSINGGSGHPSGSGKAFDGSTGLTLINDIIANNKATGTLAGTGQKNCDSSGAVSQGVNDDDDSSCAHSPRDIHANPRLGPLQDNGGPTDTMALLGGSPAINAASNALCPATDQRGISRPQPAGGTCDIGAYEATPPGASTTPATGVTTSSATLNGSVNPENLTTTYHFEWGTSTSYGQSTADTAAGAGNADESVSAAISGLKPGSLYHYRVVATNAIGTSVGADQTFQTSKPAYAGAFAPGQTDHVHGGVARVRVVCPHGTAGHCTGVLRLVYRGRVIGSARVRIGSGGSSRVSVRLSARGRHLLSRAGRLRVTARVESHDRFGTRRTRSGHITLVGRRTVVAPKFTG